MSQTIRISLPGYNALTDSNIDHYALYADSDNILIKEKARDEVEVENFPNTEITHNLGYPPFTLVYYTNGSRNYYVYGNGMYNSAATWTTSTKLYLDNKTGSTTDFQYYIFYDNDT